MLQDNTPQARIGVVLNGHQMRIVAVRAGCAESTVIRFLRGEPVRSTTEARLVKAMRPFMKAPPAP
jgi:hypothetical protein